MKLFYTMLKTFTVLVAIFISTNGQTQTVIATETFPTPHNTSFIHGPGSFTETEDLGNWTVTAGQIPDPGPGINAGQNATGAITGLPDAPYVTPPYSLVLANYVNNSTQTSYVEAASPILNLSSYNGAGSNINLGFWINTQALDPTNTCLTYTVQYNNGTSFSTTWTKTAADLVSQYGNTGWHQVSIPITNADLTTTFSVLFSGFNSPNSCFLSDQFLYIDNVQIVNGNINLPVRLLSFDATYNNNLANLHWTVDESQILNYSIERSADGKNFKSIGTIKAINNGLKTDYAFSDNLKSFSASKVFYRLAIQEASGLKQFSKVISLRLSPLTLQGISISPNPARNFTNISLNASNDQSAYMEVYDLTGKKKLTQRITIFKGVNSIQLNNLKPLPQGTYMIRTVIDGNLKTAKLIIE